MEYTSIADTGIKASRIGLGTWAIGGTMWGGTDEKTSIKTIRAALDQGITLIEPRRLMASGSPRKSSARR